MLSGSLLSLATSVLYWLYLASVLPGNHLDALSVDKNGQKYAEGSKEVFQDCLENRQLTVPASLSMTFRKSSGPCAFKVKYPHQLTHVSEHACQAGGSVLEGYRTFRKPTGKVSHWEKGAKVLYLGSSLVSFLLPAS